MAATIRKRSKGFTVVYRSVAQDQRLSLKARGLFLLMQSLPDDWQYTVAGLAAVAGTGKDQIRSGLNELLETGYLLKEQCHDEGGKFSTNIFILQEEAPSVVSAPPLPEKNPEAVEKNTLVHSGNPETTPEETPEGNPAAAGGPLVPPLSENPTTVGQTPAPLSGNPSTVFPTVQNNNINIIPPIAPQGAGAPRHEKKAAMPPEQSREFFEGFWNAYPKKKGKEAAKRAWMKLDPDLQLCQTMARALRRQKRSRDWLRDDGRYIPYPATWINGRRWEDEEDKPPRGDGPRPKVEYL